MGWALDPQALALLGRPHSVTARLTASVNGSQFVLPLPLVADSGSVQVDGKSPTRRQLSARVAASLSAPEVDVAGAELRAEYGIVDPASGTVWWTPVGTFVVVSAEEDGLGVVAVKGVDRWQRVVDAKFEQPRTTSGSTTAAITALLTEADSRITVNVWPGLSGTHQASVWESDRADAIIKLARSIGAVVYFDPLGVAQVRPVPSLGDTSYWQVGTGPGGAKSWSRRGTSRDRTYNAIAVTGQPGGELPPVYAVARDLDPNSRTLYGGPFGKKPRRYVSSLISTTAQALAAANGMLQQYLGIARTLQLGVPPHPGLDAGDVVTAEVAPGTWERHIAEAFTLPLALGLVSLDTRSNVPEDDDSGA